jgi:hypothetical protein
MKANELRIGNYVKSNDVNMSPYFIVTASFLKQNENEMSWFIDPIQLTEEWLFNFGFKDIGLNMSCSNWLVKEQKGIWRQAIRIAYSEKSEEWSLTLECVSPPTLSIVRLKYVHQLQNVYFALTGNELKCKL